MKLRIGAYHFVVASVRSGNEGSRLVPVVLRLDVSASVHQEVHSRQLTQVGSQNQGCGAVTFELKIGSFLSTTREGMNLRQSVVQKQSDWRSACVDTDVSAASW